MARIVIISQSETSRTQLSGLLASSGFQVFRTCSSESELRRAISDCEDCIVVMIGSVPDCKPDDILWDYKSSVHVLLIARPPILDNCESPEIFKLAMPASGQAVTGAIEMLTQLHQMLLPHKAFRQRRHPHKGIRVLRQQI